MESPRLTGFRKDTRPYEVTASAATQDVRKPNLVELKDLRARIVTDDQGSAARLEAATGHPRHPEGADGAAPGRAREDRYRPGGRAALRLVDFKAGTVVSEEAVTVTLATA